MSHRELTPSSVLGDDVPWGPHPQILVLRMMSHRELIFGDDVPQGAHPKAGCWLEVSQWIGMLWSQSPSTPWLSPGLFLALKTLGKSNSR